ncbi:MAG: BrnT family toxin [Pseudohongiella sp.]|nr:BrnT family toxin [Pseudohongiella sp.]
MIDFNNIDGFDWDQGNTLKVVNKHKVIPSEAEQIFFNEPLLLLWDLKHSQVEPRFHALGITDDRRLLHVTFTLRAQDTLIRIISARDMHRKERKVYEQTQTNS